MNCKVKHQPFLFRIYPGDLGMKKGIMELVDLIIVTKADGELMQEVRRLKTEWSSALRLMRRRSSNWSPKVI
jgi:LAO/AO transport system kinase